MSKRSVRKNRHRNGDASGKHRRTWPTCIRRLRAGGRGYIYEDCTITIGDTVFEASTVTVTES